MRNLGQRAFTVVEIITVVTLIGILASVGVIGLGSWKRQQATSSVKSDIHQAVSGLQDYKNFKQSYPPNLAGTGFAASGQVALKLSTNAPAVGVYDELSEDQNAQLFLNSCNANLFTTPNNTTCSFEGNKTGAKIHVQGTQSSNTIWVSPVAQQNLGIDCGDEQAICDQAISDMVSQFLAQGGEFPIFIPEKNVPLPEPTLVPNGPADRYCLEGRANNFPDIAFHVLSSEGMVATGSCPADPTLQYYQ